MSQIVEAFGLPTGTLEYTVYCRGVPIEHVHEKNLIVDGAKGMLAQLLGAANTNKKVSQIAFGTNATAAAAGNTAITGGLKKNVDGVTYPSATSVRFGFSLGTSEGNGTAISEFGLLGTDNTLFSRRVRATPIAKAADISFSGTWTIQF